jgi:hypothetical protein
MNQKYGEYDEIITYHNSSHLPSWHGEGEVVEDRDSWSRGIGKRDVFQLH